VISTETLEHLIRSYGYWALLVGTFFEGETILMLGGLAAQLGYLDLPWVMAVAFVGSFSGDQLYFFVGRVKGQDLLSKHPAWQDRAEKVHHFLKRYHDLIMLGFRFVYGIRIMTPFVLAMNHRIKTGRFVVFNAIGAVLWSVAVSAGGFLFGRALEGVLKDIRRYQIEIILFVIAAGSLLWGIHKYRDRKAR
jgi:membrane protein DedA with SNARE-associated domain